MYSKMHKLGVVALFTAGAARRSPDGGRSGRTLEGHARRKHSVCRVVRGRCGQRSPRDHRNGQTTRRTGDEAVHPAELEKGFNRMLIAPDASDGIKQFAMGMQMAKPLLSHFWHHRAALSVIRGGDG